MFERFTRPAQLVLLAAHDEARTLGHNYVGTEHVLAALVLDRESGVPDIVEAHGIDATRVLGCIAAEVGRGDWSAVRDLGLTPRAKKALQLSVDEAEARGGGDVDCAHVLLGLMRVEDSLAVRVLRELGLEPETIRRDVLALVDGSPGQP